MHLRSASDLSTSRLGPRLAAPGRSYRRGGHMLFPSATSRENNPLSSFRILSLPSTTTSLPLPAQHALLRNRPRALRGLAGVGAGEPRSSPLADVTELKSISYSAFHLRHSVLFILRLVVVLHFHGHRMPLRVRRVHQRVRHLPRDHLRNSFHTFQGCGALKSPSSDRY